MENQSLNSKPVRLQKVLIGKVAPLADGPHLSAINKTPVEGLVQVGTLGLEGDQQADRQHHGGIDKSIHHYATEHYAFWIQTLGAEYRKRFLVGGFGENFSTMGMTESNVCLGDRYQIGTAILEVSQARQPCWKLNQRFGCDELSTLCQTYIKTGWYYRVLRKGVLKAGDSLVLIDRPLPDWPLERLLRILYHTPLNTDELEALYQQTQLADSWKKTIARRLETGKVEDWLPRLYNLKDN